MPPLIPAPEEKKQTAIKIAPKHITTIPQAKIAPAPVAPKVQIPLQQATRTNGTNGTSTTPLPFPLLILNGLPAAPNTQTAGSLNGVKKENGVSATVPNGKSILKLV